MSDSGSRDRNPSRHHRRPRHRHYHGEEVHTVRTKHSMRKSPYLVSLFFLLAATSLTLLNIWVADLIRVVAKNPGPTSFETKYGLYQRCVRKLHTPALLLRATPLLEPSSNLSDIPSLKPTHKPGRWSCEPFPPRSECEELGETFCVLWDSAGYSAQLALVPCLFALVSLLFIFLHQGKRMARARARRKQWKLISGAMLVHCTLQALSLAIILRVYKTDARFASGAHLARSLWFGVAAAIVSAITFVFLTFTGLAARRGEPWAAGRSARQARRHKRTRSGRVITVPEGTHIPPDQIVTVGEVVAAADVDEHTALLSPHASFPAAGGSKMRATE